MSGNGLFPYAYQSLLGLFNVSNSGTANFDNVIINNSLQLLYGTPNTVLIVDPSGFVVSATIVNSNANGTNSALSISGNNLNAAFNMTQDLGIGTGDVEFKTIKTIGTLDNLGDTPSPQQYNLLIGSGPTTSNINIDMGANLSTGALNITFGSATGFTNLFMPGANIPINGALYIDTFTQIQSARITNGQILIGATSGHPAAGNITSLDGSITVTNGANTIDLSSTTGTDTFGHITLINTSNQLIIQPGNSTNKKFTITAPNPAADRTITIADPGSAATIAMYTGTSGTDAKGALGLAYFDDSSDYNLTLGIGSSLGAAGGSYLCVAVGNNAGSSSMNSSAVYNTILGCYTANAITGGLQNTIVGGQAFTLNTTGARNTALGYGTLIKQVAISDNTAVGANAGQSATGTFGTFVGSGAGEGNGNASSGADNTAVGYGSLNQYTTGGDNTCVGYLAGQNITTGFQNTFIGSNSGMGVLTTTTGTENTAVGYNTLSSYTTGGNNTAIGYSNLFSVTTGANNTGIGNRAGRFVSTSSDNTCLGYEAGFGTTSGAALSTGSNNTLLGSLSDTSTAGATNRMALGYQAVNSTDNTCMIGNTSITSIDPGVNTAGLGLNTAFGGGINFGQSVLKFYQQGTWTPGLQSGGSSAGVTYTSQSGNYTRIGNRCICDFYIQTSAALTTAGNILITGLPFTVTGGNPADVWGAGWTVTLANVTLIISPNGTTTNANLNYASPAGSYSNVTQALMNAVIIVSGNFTFTI